MSSAHPSAVVDTNVILSSFLAPRSTSARALVLLSSTYDLLASFETLIELRETWSRPKFDKSAPPERRRQILAAFEPRLRLVQSNIRIRACRDPRDDKFLELAVSGGAELILTGDADLLALHPFRGIAILTPGGYLAGLPSPSATAAGT